MHPSDLNHTMAHWTTIKGTNTRRSVCVTCGEYTEWDTTTPPHLGATLGARER